jgi:hypothetical protein
MRLLLWLFWEKVTALKGLFWRDRKETLLLSKGCCTREKTIKMCNNRGHERETDDLLARGEYI